jgi:LacI family transcriptional regulator
MKLKVHKGAIRIKDIAEKAQVSVGTVDRVIHNRGRVSEDVREKINQIIKELNYEPNLIARSLGTNKTYHFAALIPDPSDDQYWSDCKSGVEKAFRELKGFGVLVEYFYFDPHKVTSFIEQCEIVTTSEPAGILIAPLFLRESITFLNRWTSLEIPFITINTLVDQTEDVFYIGQDSYQSGKVAGRLLSSDVSDDCTLVVTHIEEDIQNSAHLINKERGFRDFFMELGNKVKVITADLPNQDHITFFENLDYLFAENPEIKGMYVTTSKAFAIAKYFKKRGIEGIRLIGYDLLDKNIQFLTDGLIDFLINQNPKGQGYWGISSLTDKIIFKKELKKQRLLPLDIIIRENLKYYMEGEV